MRDRKEKKKKPKHVGSCGPDPAFIHTDGGPSEEWVHSYLCVIVSLSSLETLLVPVTIGMFCSNSVHFEETM